MSKEKLSKAIKEVFEELRSLTEEEFKVKLKSHEEGDIARIILETNALHTTEIEADSSYDEYINLPVGSTIMPLANISYDKWNAMTTEINSQLSCLFDDIKTVSWPQSSFNQMGTEWTFMTMPIIETVYDQLSFIDKSSAVSTLHDIYTSCINIPHAYPQIPAVYQKTIEITADNPVNTVPINDEESELEWAA